MAIKGPGKTPPRLIADLLDYVPKTVENGYNLLADPAQQFWNKPLSRRGQNDCRHNLMRKDDQTLVPTADEECVNFSSYSYVSAICSRCRYHFIISVGLLSGEYGEHGEPCNPYQLKNPLHHLIFQKSSRALDMSRPSEISKYDGFFEIYEYKCSRLSCPTFVKIKVLPPRLDNNLLKLIEDPEILELRGRDEILKDPLRFSGEKPASPLAVLKHLGSYLVDALKSSGEPRKIATRNKKYRLSFADDCSDIFKYLDFTYIKEEIEGDEPNFFWELPRITEKNKDFLDDILYELTFRANEKQTQPNTPLLLPFDVPAMNKIKVILGYASYPERTRYYDDRTEEHPYYASLGAVEDFTDELLSWAYDRQCEYDPVNKPYYFDCLEGLARGRKSYSLQTKVLMATSAGDYGTKAIEEAYEYFELNSATRVSDHRILDLYRRNIKWEPQQKDMAQSCLKKIAKHRNSPNLEAVANDKTMTFKEALDFLGVNSETTPEFIEASAVVMFVDGDKNKVASALQTIAKNRPGSMILQRAAASMASEIGEVTLSIDDAYKRLQISSHDISDEGILNYFQSLSNGSAAGSKESFTEALRVIALDRNSNFLLSKLVDPDAEVQALKADPLGLDNIGNTCYLNSLLQYYYSVKPLRNMVMDFDKYRMVLNDENLSKKKVGGRQVEKAEVIKAQNFVEELRKLFIKLKTASTRSVRPTKELAALTIFSTQAEEAARKNSISSLNLQKNNGQILENSTESCPQWPSSPSIDEYDVDKIVNLNDDASERGDTSSEITLVDADLSLRSASEFKENFSISQPNVKKKNEVFLPMSELKTISSQELNSTPPAPERPPPVPPREISDSITSNNEVKDTGPASKIWDFGTQQDVTEVIGNVLFRFQCAITATGYEIPSGEQIDIIRESFFGANTVYTQKAQNLQKKVEAWSYLLVFPAKNVPRSIYEALDVSFDEQIVEIDKQHVPQFTSISRLPRILQFHIQRTAFDQENLRSWKNRTPVTIPETLYLDRYMDDSGDLNSTIMKRRRETWMWKKQLSALEARFEVLTQVQEGLTVPDALIATKDWINDILEFPIDGISVNPDLSSLLEKRIAQVALELQEISGRIELLQDKLKNQFADMREYQYTLHAVFIHHGEVGGGHYWVYIYDSENDIWRQYNDESVTEVKNRDFIFKHESVGGGTPYYVVYVQSSLYKDLVDPVFRDVKQTEMIDVNNCPVALDGDVLMTNGDEGMGH